MLLFLTIGMSWLLYTERTFYSGRIVSLTFEEMAKPQLEDILPMFILLDLFTGCLLHGKLKHNRRV